MDTTSKQNTSENGDQPLTVSEIAELLEEADQALLEGKAALTHSCLRKAIEELKH